MLCMYVCMYVCTCVYEGGDKAFQRNVMLFEVISNLLVVYLQTRNFSRRIWGNICLKCD